MSVPAASTLPSPGQLVTVRQRRYVVTGVAAGAVQRDLFADLAEQAAQHLVSLQSVEDDGLGEELQVIWEIEPGTHVHDRAALPDPTAGFDPPRRLDAFLDAVRWGAVASADVRHLNAPFRSGITIEDYQLDPVVRALQMPRVSLLIADDVGLGKTIEAGLVVQELLLRHRARTMLVVCPAGLQIQWRDQMRDKFGLELRIVDSQLMKELRRRRGLHVNPWTHFPRLITSIDFLKRERPLRRFTEILPAPGQPAFPRKLDLLIVDEAHNVAPAGRGHYAVDSLRTQAIRALAPHFEHKLFLTATPHNGYTESFGALLELLDDQRFHRSAPIDRNQLAAVMVRRLKRELPPDDLGRQRFPRRELEAIEVPYTDAERRAHQALTEYTRLRAERARDDTERYATEFVLKLLKKRLFSSPEAFLLTLERHRDTLRQGRARRRPAPPTLGLLRREVEEVEEDHADDIAYEERTLEAVQATTEAMRPLGADEEALLDELETWAKGASGRPDSKAHTLIDWLHRTLRPGGAWPDGVTAPAERVIIFTEYRATQNWLLGLLSAEGFTPDDRLRTLYGGMPTDRREAVKAAFQAGPDVSTARVLLATDAASEGIDLQNHCARLIHYEIPWNPSRMEQRAGRIDRHGQRAPSVHIYHFVGQGYAGRADGAALQPGALEGDLEFLMHVARKVDQIREDLGNVGDVIARQVEEAMLGRRVSLDADLRTRRGDEARAMLRFERKLRAELDRLHQQLLDSRASLRLDPENLQAVVEVGLALAGHPPLRPVPIAGPRGARATAFHVPVLGGTWAACADGLAHPHTGEIRPIVFDHDLAVGRDDVVLCHLNHRLVQMCLGLLRAEVWAPEGQRKLHRASVRVVPDRDLDTPVVIAHARLVVTGSDGVRLHEEIITAGGAVRGDDFKRLGVGDIERALQAAAAAARAAGPAAGAALETDPTEAPARVREALAGHWSEHASRLLTALEARVRDRQASLAKLLAERAGREAADLAHVLDELRRSILAEIDAPPPTQLELWTTPEREQLERNRDDLRRRADAVPAEIERETAAIRARYADPQPRMFPVAVTYLVPERLAR